MTRQTNDSDREELTVGAMAIRAHGEAILDGTHVVTEIPETYGYALIALAGWVETEAAVVNARTRPYALAVVRSFVWGGGEIA